MNEEQFFGESQLSSLDTYRLARAALEGEKSRLVAKYDARIAAIQQAIAALEAKAAEAKAAEPVRKPRRKRASDADSQQRDEGE